MMREEYPVAGLEPAGGMGISRVDSLAAAGNGRPGKLATSRAQPLSIPAVVECRGCGQFYRLPALHGGSRAVCQRCGGLLRRYSAEGLDRTLAFSFCGLVLIAIANLLPFMSLSIEGRIQDANLITGAIELYDRGMYLLAAAVVSTTILAPLLKVGSTIYVLLGLRMRRPPPFMPRVFRLVERLTPWAMIEVYMLGVFVAYVKLLDLATIEVGTALYAVAMLMVTMAAANAAIDTDAVWEAMERRGVVPALEGATAGRRISCHSCGLVLPAETSGDRCPRCQAVLHARRPQSLTRCLALVLAAIILYIPANVFPVMTIISFGSGFPSTILGGVAELLTGGMWPLALLVFFASITVPVLKLIGLIFLMLSVRLRSRWRLRDRTRIYRIIDAVGRWSMIDIFMLSILAGLVQLGSIATIKPGVGAVSFAAVVVITMFAAAAFDPRLMWDAAGENR
jgi:paraquat-inducible protein A